MNALKKCILFLGVIMLCAAFAGCAAKPENPSPNAEEDAIVSFLREYFTLNCQDVATSEDIGADYSRYWIEEPENKGHYEYFLRDTEAKKWLYSRDGHELTEASVEVTCNSLALTDDGAAARVCVAFRYYDQKAAAVSENYNGSATGINYDVRLQKRGDAWRIADLDFTDDATESLKDASLTMDEFKKKMTPIDIAGWPPRDFQPVYAEVGLGSGFPLSYLNEAELQALWDILQRLEPDPEAKERPLQPAFRVLFYGPYDTEKRGSEQILEWYILDDTCSLVRRKGETDLYAVPPDGAIDDVRFLCENTRVIERTADELSSAFESLRAHCLENGTDVRRLWYNAELSSPYVLWRISRARYEEGITIAEENCLQLFCEGKRADTTAYQVYSFDLKRESADSPWVVYPQGIAGTFQELHSGSCIDDHAYPPGESTSLCCYTDTGREVRADAEGALTPEQAAEALARMYMDGLCEESDTRTFRITEYRDLAVTVALTASMDRETRAIYSLSDDEIGDTQWVVEIEVQYKYEGVKSPLGPSNGEWIDILYQGSPVGFLLTRDGNGYSLRFRKNDTAVEPAPASYYDRDTSESTPSEGSIEDVMIAKCTHVIAAEYAGRVPAYCDEELEFIPAEALKGTVEEPSIHVQAGSAYFQYHKEPEAGEAVILVGSRHTSIYYPHDIYTVVAILKDTPEERERIEEVLRTAPPVERTHYGPEITYSEDIEDILAVTGLVFLAEPTAVTDHGVYAPTVLCRCRVLQAYVGQPIYSEINIVFFEDTVAVGNEYLVLVNQIDDGNIYIPIPNGRCCII